MANYILKGYINCVDGRSILAAVPRMIDRVNLRVIDKIRGVGSGSMAGDLSMHKFRGRHWLINLAKTNGRASRSSAVIDEVMKSRLTF